MQRYSVLSNELQKETRRVSRDNWRRFIQELTEDQSKPYNKGLWILSKWSRKASTAKVDPQLPDLRRSIEDPFTDNNITKADIFAAKFFPKTGIVDFNNIEIKATMK